MLGAPHLQGGGCVEGLRLGECPGMHGASTLQRSRRTVLHVQHLVPFGRVLGVAALKI